MALAYSEKGELGDRASEFELLGTDDRRHALADFGACKALVLVFMCNHCPYVKAVRERINRLAHETAPLGAQVVGINSNDSARYPADSFVAMKKESTEQGYVFPYLWDETQTVARAFGAVCTPDFYVYRNDGASGFSLQYRGRLDDSWKDESAVTRRDLRAAVDAILSGAEPDRDQIASMGCSIKWAAIP